jgi:hypothetical protein
LQDCKRERHGGAQRERQGWREYSGMTSKMEFPLALDEAAPMDEPTKLTLVGKSLHHNAAPADRRVNPDALICARIEATT